MDGFETEVSIQSLKSVAVAFEVTEQSVVVGVRQERFYHAPERTRSPLSGIYAEQGKVDEWVAFCMVAHT